MFYDGLLVDMPGPVLAAEIARRSLISSAQHAITSRWSSGAEFVNGCAHQHTLEPRADMAAIGAVQRRPFGLSAEAVEQGRNGRAGSITARVRAVETSLY